MVKGKFTRLKPQLQRGHDRPRGPSPDDADGGDHEGLSRSRFGWGEFVSYQDVAKASAAQCTRDDSKILTIATSHVEYSTAARHYAHVDCRATPRQSRGDQ
jgi:elongation factor Tu